MRPATNHFSHNLRRLMARFDLTIEGVSQRTGLDDRTIKGLLSGRNIKPHARTLHRLAAGLGVDAGELFQSPLMLARRDFDRATNAAVDEAVAARPELFAEFTSADFDDLYSRVGTGGGLTPEGAVQAAAAINRKRELHDKLALLLETDQAELIAGIVELLYARVRVSE